MKLNSALQLLHSSINWEEAPDSEVTVILTKDHISIDEGPEFKDVPISLNPIKRMFEFISSEMCVDCLSIDYLYRDIFFVSLAKAYIEYLVANYGPEVSISKEMAAALIKHQLSGYKVQCRTLDDVIELDQTNYLNHISDKCIYNLVAELKQDEI